jgi:hypothetical protein
MSTKAIEMNASGAMIPITAQDLKTFKSQRSLMHQFVSSQLKEANFKNENAEDYGEGDYGIIPGTKKKVLLKPGAEKLLRLFGLGVRVRLADKEVDRHENFALFTYRAEIYSLRSGTVVAECEGAANSQEFKYRERTVWRKNANGTKESVKEQTPICDILNPLMKMAQKRALVGATVVATMASDFFTADVESRADAEALGIIAKRPPKDAAKLPEVVVKSEVVTADETASMPICCGKEMMVSRYKNRETGNFDWYCLKCKKSQARAA